MRKLKTTQGVALFLKLFTIMIMVLACTAGCKKDKDESGNNSNTTEMQDVVLQGIVTDANNNPLDGVLVISGATTVATTDSKGMFYIKKVGVINKRAVLKFEKTGYFTLTRSGVKEKEMFISAVLQLKGDSEVSTQKTFSTETATTLNVGQMKVDIPSSSIMKADGKEYSGTVKADMLYLNPDNKKFADMMPGGDLAGVRTNGDESMLISYGMSDVLFTDNNGNPLQIKSGTSAKVSFPVPESMKNNPPASMPLWSFDEEKGIWIEEGVFTLENGLYVGTATHFSWINCDDPQEIVKIKGKVVDCEGDPLPNVPVCSGQTAIYTNENGEFSGAIPANTATTISVTFNGETEVKSLPAHPAGSEITVETFQVPCKNVKIKGKVIDCDKKPVVGVKVSVDITAAYTNSKGEYLLFVPKETPLTVRLPANADSEPLPGQPDGTTYTVRDLVVCDENPGLGTATAVEKGSIKISIYQYYAIYTWDNYGKRFRHDRLENLDDKESDFVKLINHFDKTYFWGDNDENGGDWDPEKYDPSLSLIELHYAIPSIDEENMASFRVYPDEIVAGKTCKVFLFNDDGKEMRYTTWNGLMMKQQINGTTIINTIDATLDVPEEAFTQTFTISWLP